MPSSEAKGKLNEDNVASIGAALRKKKGIPSALESRGDVDDDLAKKR